MSIKDNFGNPQGFVGKLMLMGMNMGHSPMAKWAFTQFEVPDSGHIADIGCGGGYNVKRLLSKSSQGVVYGVDISNTCVEKSIAVNKKNIGKRCEIHKGSADNLPFDDNFFDLITAFETVYFWKDINKCFNEIKRVLNKGGKFVIVNDPGDPNKHWEDMIPDMTAWTAEQLETLMRDEGFSNVKVTKSKYKYCVIGTKND